VVADHAARDQAVVADHAAARNADPSTWAPLVLVGERG
jgi:hypothetical protein